MSETKMIKHQVTTKWHYWNVQVLQKTRIQEKKQYDYGIFEVQPISYKMECLDTCLYMPIYAWNG